MAFETETFWGAFTRPFGPIVKKPIYLEAQINVKGSVQFLAEQRLGLSFRVWIYHQALFSAQTWPHKLKTIWKMLMFSMQKEGQAAVDVQFVNQQGWQ